MHAAWSYRLLMLRAPLHLHELVKCRWAEEVNLQLETLQLQSPGRSLDTAHNDMFVKFLSLFSRCFDQF